MAYTKEFIKKIIQLGMIAYDIDRIVIICDEVPESELRIDFEEEGSKIHDAYKKGQYLAEFNIDMKLMDLAGNGDLKAIDRLKQRKEERKILDKKKRKKKKPKLIL
ncbi:MAG: hypothetical protein GWP19_00840 [Planctomycetia bacterium]|nr:hypothetical protein [Planctomycetia bacterium]